MTYPVFASGDVLNASDMNAVGLWLVKTQTIGSAVSSVTVTGAFSADYDAYKILVSGGVGSTDIGLNLQLGSTTTGYYAGYGGATFAGVADNGGVANSTAFPNCGYATTNNLYANIDLQNPFLARHTNAQYLWAAVTTTGRARGYAGYLADTTSYTAFTFTLTSGTLTGGTIRIYGYRN